MTSLFASSESKFFETSVVSSLRKAQNLTYKDAFKVSSEFDETLAAIVEELLYSAWGEDTSLIETRIGRLSITLFVEKHIGFFLPIALCVSEGFVSHCWLITSKYRPNGFRGIFNNSPEIRDYFMIKLNASIEEMKEIVSNLDK